MPQGFLPFESSRTIVPREARGAVFTKPWVVDLLLDLAGYLPDADLVDALAIEPAAGDGGFLVPMARRLVASCRKSGRPLGDCADSLVGYEIDDGSATAARAAVARGLMEIDVPDATAAKLAAGWVRSGDFLLDAFRLPKADFVIANPPYIRLEDVDDEMTRLYRDAYATMRGRADLYVAFIEASLRLLKPGGVCSFICADRWMLNQYGEGLRRLVTGGHGVEAVVEMHEADAFEDDVSAYPAVTVIRRSPQGRAVVASVGREAGGGNGSGVVSALKAAARGEEVPPVPGMVVAAVEGWFTGGDPWPCGSPKRLALLRWLEERFEPLESEATGTRVGIGVATGRDGVFITRDAGLVETSRLLPLALASDTTSGRLQWSGHYLVDPWDDEGLVKLPDHPRLKAYLEKHRESLAKRHVAEKNPTAWYRTIDRVNRALVSLPKLYVPDIKDRLNPVLDSGATYPHHNLYVITSNGWDLEVLGGLLLSAVGQLFIESYGVRMRGGYLRFQAQYLRRIRVPNPNAIPKARADELIRAFRERDRELATRAACSIYGIDPEALEAAIGR